jgi:hypothetical protein
MPVLESAANWSCMGDPRFWSEAPGIGVGAHGLGRWLAMRSGDSRAGKHAENLDRHVLPFHTWLRDEQRRSCKGHTTPRHAIFQCVSHLALTVHVLHCHKRTLCSSWWWSADEWVGGVALDKHHRRMLRVTSRAHAPGRSVCAGSGLLLAGSGSLRAPMLRAAVCAHAPGCSLRPGSGSLRAPMLRAAAYACPQP